MLRSMYSGISGMKGFQNKLDVIGNNIANVNTHGFKKGRVTFKDMVSQQVAGASAAGDLVGGTNPKQVGLGSQIGTIDTIHSQGSLQTTGEALDLSISGDGFFVVDSGNEILYTRAGNFTRDGEGNVVVKGEGYYLQSTDGEPINIPPGSKSVSVSPDGVVSYITEDGELEEAGTITIANFANPGGLEKVGGNLYRGTNNSGEPEEGLAPGEGGSGTIVSGALEMSNVDLSDEFTEMIVAQRGFQANSRIITTSDEILQELVNLKR
ncbi:flagellar basal body rod protein FlgG [Bacillus thermotolerans]|uniref:flagellar basal body rod protein FlgG n=1 Tax=Bacillus thermotolerans TaxID=1221996 RepID=UPI00057DD5A8|nr:flagellar basal body rod protein FlgG [Bacillus thermotolerans]KKB38971.1 Flagellar basal-body rod protein FlgG [Bacillus thermotolerans]KKB44672.1 Flagellar basal-body rod protein FlgG [Bacillus thermotolerans]